MLGVPQPSPWDLNFRILGIPIRITPWFWIISAALGWSDGDFQRIVVWVGCVLVSILVHEMGHALTNRAFGRQPAILLHGMGGLCFANEGPPISRWKRILIIFDGPLAGFMLYGLVLLIMRFARVEDPITQEILIQLAFINLVWSILNLIPIWPLDGGQIAGVILQGISRRRGQELTHGISLVLSALLAIWMYQRSGSIYNILLLSMFAMNNFQMLQLIHQRQWQDPEDSEQWWRR
jgi:stage IV sporulation protein FB